MGEIETRRQVAVVSRRSIAGTFSALDFFTQVFGSSVVLFVFSLGYGQGSAGKRRHLGQRYSQTSTIVVGLQEAGKSWQFRGGCLQTIPEIYDLAQFSPAA